MFCRLHRASYRFMPPRGITETLSDVESVRVVHRGKIVGGIYDDRFLVKNVKAVIDKMPDADLELPYEGAKEMLLVDDVDNKEFLKELFEAMYDELPATKKKK